MSTLRVGTIISLTRQYKCPWQQLPSTNFNPWLLIVPKIITTAVFSRDNNIIVKIIFIRQSVKLSAWVFKAFFSDQLKKDNESGMMFCIKLNFFMIGMRY